jgi:hypothetical protein
VQPRPQSGVDDLVGEVVRHVEVPHRVEVPPAAQRGRTRGYRGRSGSCRGRC